MEAEAPHQHRSAIAVVAGIVYVLQIQAGENPAPHVSVVIGLCNIFSPIIERAIAQKEASTQRQVVLVVGRDAVRNE